MKTAVFPAPNGMPARIGQIQWTGGVHVHANQSWPTGAKTAATQTMLTMASEGTFPVAGSGLWALIMRRMRGSAMMMAKQPIARPVKERPVRPVDQWRRPVKTMG